MFKLIYFYRLLLMALGIPLAIFLNVNTASSLTKTSAKTTANIIDQKINTLTATSNTDTPQVAKNYLYKLKGNHNYDIESLVFTPDGQTLISGSLYDKIHIWDLKARKLRTTLDAGKEGVYALTLSPDGKILVSGGGFAQINTDKNIRLWDWKTGRLIRKLTGHSQGITSVKITPDGKTLISASSDKTIKLWHLQTGKLIRTLKGHNSPIKALAISADGKILASSGGDFDANSDAAIRLWDIKTGKLLQTLKLDKQQVIGFLAFSQDSTTLISSPGPNLAGISASGTTLVWNIKTGKLVHNIPRRATFVAFSKDEKNLLIFNPSYGVELWNLASGAKIRDLMAAISYPHGLDVDRIYLTGVAISPDGETVAFGDGGVLSEHQIGIGKIVTK